MSLSRKAAGAALVAALGAGAVVFGGSGVVRAQSQPPAARIFGNITVNGQNAASGAVVTAYGTNNALCGTSTGQGVYNGTVYYVDIDSSNSSCNAAGTNLTFKVNGASSSSTTQVPSVPGSAVQLNLVVAAATGPSSTVTYNAGWNLVGGPTGQMFNGAANPLYTFQAGDSNYEQVSNTTGISVPRGYWAYFTAATTVTIAGTAPTGPTTVSAPAGQYIQVGNPNPTANVTVSGADSVYTYDPVAGQYTATTTLKPGQGAWVLSNAGGTVTIQ